MAFSLIDPISSSSSVLTALAGTPRIRLPPGEFLSLSYNGTGPNN